VVHPHIRGKKKKRTPQKRARGTASERGGGDQHPRKKEGELNFLHREKKRLGDPRPARSREGDNQQQATRGNNYPPSTGGNSPPLPVEGPGTKGEERVDVLRSEKEISIYGA